MFFIIIIALYRSLLQSSERVCVSGCHFHATQLHFSPSNGDDNDAQKTKRRRNHTQGHLHTPLTKHNTNLIKRLILFFMGG